MFFWFILGGTSYRRETNCWKLIRIVAETEGQVQLDNVRLVKASPGVCRQRSLELAQQKSFTRFWGFLLLSVQVPMHQNGKGFDKQRRDRMPKLTVHLEDHSWLEKSQVHRIEFPGPTKPPGWKRKDPYFQSSLLIYRGAMECPVLWLKSWAVTPDIHGQRIKSIRLSMWLCILENIYLLCPLENHHHTSKPTDVIPLMP